jgi:hypothetical protein
MSDVLRRLTLGRLKCQEIIQRIEADDRYQAPPALVAINAPLALIQVDLTAKIRTAREILRALGGELKP